MIKETVWTKAVDELVALEMGIIDGLIDELIEPLADIGNPEKVLGKKYEQWTPQDFQQLTMVYGTAEPNALSELIFKKEYEKVKQLEQGVQ